MAPFDPSKDLNFIDELDDVLYRQGGYGSGLALGLSVDGFDIPFRTVSQLDRTEVASGSDNSSSSPAPGPSRPAAPSRFTDSPTSLSSGSTHSCNSDFAPGGARYNERRGHAGDGNAELAGSDDEGMEVAQGKSAKSKGSRKEVQTEEEAQPEQESRDSVAQEVHRNRFESDFGILRVPLSEAELSLIRDGWAALTNVRGTACFKAKGGAWSANKGRGVGAVWINSDEDTFRDALFWAMGRRRVMARSQCKPQYQNSYREARQERSHELERVLDVARVEGMMDAARMHSNRQARLSKVLQILPDDREEMSDPTRAEAIINAIAGKHVDLNELKQRLENTGLFGYGPLPSSMQVNVVNLEHGPVTEILKMNTAADWKADKEALDLARIKARAKAKAARGSNC